MKVTYMTLTHFDALLESGSAFWFKVDFILDILYVARTPIVIPGVKSLFIITIILPYVIFVYDSYNDSKSLNVFIVDFLGNFFNSDHLIKYSNVID
jgi:hypothetical protein